MYGPVALSRPREHTSYDRDASGSDTANHETADRIVDDRIVWSGTARARHLRRGTMGRAATAAVTAPSRAADARRTSLSERAAGSEESRKAGTSRAHPSTSTEARRRRRSTAAARAAVAGTRATRAEPMSLRPATVSKTPSAVPSLGRSRLASADLG